jgi:cell wall-associated NlpC family hydrolase
MDLLIRYAMSFVGLPYRWGGDDPMEGFDCSGLVQEILASAGMDPPGDQTAQALYDHFEKTGTVGAVGPGVLAFYGQSVRKITHVGFCIDQYRMVEAGGGGSRTINLKAAVDQNAYVRIRLVTTRKDLVATINPRYKPIGVI